MNVHEAYYEVVWRRDSNTERMSADFFWRVCGSIRLNQCVPTIGSVLQRFHHTAGGIGTISRYLLESSYRV